MKRWICGLIGAMLVMCCMTACKNDKPATGVPVNRPASVNGNQEQQTLSNMKVYIKDITAYAGEDIDYIGAIESAENLELNRSMIYVDSSLVDNHTPGVYKALYTFDYMGSTVSSAAKVTILENPEPVTETTGEVTGETAGETTEASAETTTEASAETTAEAPAETSTEPSETETAPAAESVPVSTEPVTAVVEQSLPPAEITLASGRVVTIQMTSSRYITETYTDETYYEENGMTFQIAELKVVFNTGEVQVVETVVTRVQPQEISTESETGATK